jgi:3-oxoacyl-[acyl-carrier-protein] synthase III
VNIEGLASSFPERLVANDEVVARLEQGSADTHEPGTLAQTLKVVSRCLEYTGIQTRRWLSPGESPFAHVDGAVRRCLAQAGVRATDVDALIFASVDRRVLEPGESFFIAKALGMRETQCFDILEACNGWSRTAHVAEALIRTRQVRNVLVVTAEFTAHEGEWVSSSYRLTSSADLEWAFPAYTLGESASATLLAADDGNPWSFDFRARPEFADACMLPLDDYPEPMTRMGSTTKAGRGGRRFVSYGRRLHQAGFATGMELLGKYRELKDDVKIVIPHSHSQRCWIDAADTLGLAIPFYFVYPRYGNLVTGSVPCALSLAIEEGRVERGDRVFAIVPAAGMSLASYTFRY